MSEAALPVIDVHTHLAGVGHGGTNCFITPRRFNSWLFRLMCWQLGISGADRETRLDQAYLERMDQEVNTAADAVKTWPERDVLETAR